MKYLKQFSIPVAGLETGTHQYEFDIDQKFFEDVSDCEIQKCSIHVILDLTKQEDMMLLEFQFQGNAELICDRCLDILDMPLEGSDEVLLKYSRNADKNMQDEDTINPEQHELDIWQYIYDFISLNIPFRKVHPDDEDGNSTCNP